MWINLVRKRIHEQLENVFAFALREAFNRKLVAFGQDLLNLWPIFTGQFQVQFIVFNFGFPKLVQLFRAGWPR